MMLEVSLLSWLLSLFLVVIYSFATLRFTRLLPWSNEVQNSNIPFVFGLAIAPFIFGAITILALGLLPEANHILHLLFILAVPFFSALASFLFESKDNINIKKSKTPFAFDEKIAVSLLLAFTACLLINSLFFPLLQNDSLEYATVGRILFETRNLTSYPALNPEQTASGLYAPWTHPPLYVALIYASYLLQGSTDTIGLMRLITPWFALLSVALTYCIGSLINRRTGLFAAILLFSTPIFFLGVDSALIDALPMLGLLIVFTTIIAVKTTPTKAGIIQGVILGFALWTHSQAILFLPLSLVAIFLSYGCRGWHAFIKNSMLLIINAILIAAFPYIRNLMIYGSLVSDNNSVFSLPQLGWADYFKEDRGLNSITSIIQYGVFKGWFTPEYYGFTFWIMTLAIIYFCYKFLSFASFKQALLGERVKSFPYHLWIALGVVAAYLGGIILSVSLGIDLMIRNERYLLVIFPFVALLSGWFVAICIQEKSDGLIKYAKFILISSILGMVSIQLLYFSKYRFTVNKVAFSEIFASQNDKLLKFSEIKVMDFLKNNTAASALILSTRPSSMIYSERKMVSYLDPRLIDFYLSKTPEEGVALLKRIGITHIHLTDYSLPVFYNSELMNVLANPKLSSLIYSAGGSQIYSLINSGLDYKKITDISPETTYWIEFKQYKILGKKGAAEIDTDATPINKQEFTTSASQIDIFQRNFSTILMTDKNKSSIEVGGNGEYIINFSLSGEGLLDFFILQFDEYKNLVKGKVNLGNLVFREEEKQSGFIHRIKFLPETRFIQLGIEQHGNSRAIIKNASLIELKGTQQ